MENSLLAFVQSDFETKIAAFVILVFLTTIPFCVRRRRWPDVAQVMSMSLCAAAGTLGIKIIALVLLLPVSQLGLPGTDKTALMLGGLVALIVSSKEASLSWRKITGNQ